MCGGGSSTTLPAHPGSLTFNSTPAQPNPEKQQRAMMQTKANKTSLESQGATQLTGGS